MLQVLKVYIVFLLCFIPQVYADTIGSVEVEGHKKIEKDAILAKIKSQPGTNFRLDQIKADVTQLYKMGYFYNITVKKDNVGEKLKLIFEVEEKPSVSEIFYLGNVAVKKEDLEEAAALKPFEILNYQKINQAVDKIQKLYEEKGFFLAGVDYEITPTKDKEKVQLTFKIREGDNVMVKQIRFIGNQKISSSKLKAYLRTSEGGFFSFISDSGAFKQDVFDQDLQILNYIYFNEGFVQVKISHPQVYVTPDKKAIYITIHIEEGEQFNVGTLDFSGDLMFSNEELRNGAQLNPNELFVSEKLQKDLQTIKAKYGDLGYAFTNVIPKTRINDKERLVDITYQIEKGNKVYFNKINVLGNHRTRDKVVRRELQIVEGELYNESRKTESLESVKRLGYFEDVSFNTKTPEGHPELLDLDIVVKERTTGSIQVGAGYSSFAGFVFNGQINETNLLGRGQKLGLSMDVNKKQSLFNLNFTEPYYDDSKWSVGFDLYQSRDRRTEYEQTKTGGAVRVGHPLAAYTYGYIRPKVDYTKLNLGADGDEELYPVETANGETRSLEAMLIYDKRDDRFAPTKGIFTRATVEYAGLGGDKFYTKGDLTFRYYKNIFWDVVWRNNVTYGAIDSNKSGQPVPFNELYLLGGANTLRGYQFFTVGKRKRSGDAFDRAIAEGKTTEEAETLAMRPFGGKQQLFYNLEFQFPLVKEQKIFGVVFYDVGQAEDNLTFDDFKSNVGFGFRWFSPIGPLRFEWGFPLNRNKELEEETMQFQFAIGTPF